MFAWNLTGLINYGDGQLREPTTRSINTPCGIVNTPGGIIGAAWRYLSRDYQLSSILSNAFFSGREAAKFHANNKTADVSDAAEMSRLPP